MKQKRERIYLTIWYPCNSCKLLYSVSFFFSLLLSLIHLLSLVSQSRKYVVGRKLVAIFVLIKADGMKVSIKLGELRTLLVPFHSDLVQRNIKIFF